jgi:hypothetical protein
MVGMDGWQWLIVAGGMVIVFVIMEAEKSLRNYLTYLKYDTDDQEFDEMFDSAPDHAVTQLPAEADRFGKGEATR